MSCPGTGDRARLHLCLSESVGTKLTAKAERSRQRPAVNVVHLLHKAEYLHAAEIQSSVCGHNGVLSFQSSDVCTQTLKLQKASWKHRLNSSHIDCIHAVWSLQNVILKNVTK